MSTVIDDLGIVWTFLVRTRLRGKFETHSGTLRLIVLGHLAPNDFWTSQMVGPVQWPTGTGVVCQLCALFERYDCDPHDRKGGGLVILISQLREETLYP